MMHRMKNNSRTRFFLATTMWMMSLLIGGSAAFASGSYFDMSQTENHNIAPFTKWTRMMSRFSSQKKVPDSMCDKVKFHPCSILDWRSLLEGIRDKSLDAQLNEVNKWSNAHTYIEDQLNWGVVDYWETPYEFMTINGDCEDYAISKYYSLRALGMSPDKMRIIIVQDLNLGGIIHAILGVYDNNGELQILDNQSSQVRPALSIYHYRPVYGINEKAWWTYTPNNS